jgi:hypothetical protein
MPSVVYIVRANTLRRIKIGRTSNLYARLATIQTSCPAKLVLIGTIACPEEGQAKRLEGVLLKWFSAKRSYGEWFWLTKTMRLGLREMVKLDPETLSAFLEEEMAKDAA